MGEEGNEHEHTHTPDTSNTESRRKKTACLSLKVYIASLKGCKAMMGLQIYEKHSLIPHEVLEGPFILHIEQSSPTTADNQPSLSGGLVPRLPYRDRNLWVLKSHKQDGILLAFDLGTSSDLPLKTTYDHESSYANGYYTGFSI